MTPNLTDPRPRLIDRLRAAISAFKDPGGAFTRGTLTEVRVEPLVRAAILAER